MTIHTDTDSKIFDLIFLANKLMPAEHSANIQMSYPLAQATVNRLTDGGFITKSDWYRDMQLTPLGIEKLKDCLRLFDECKTPGAQYNISVNKSNVVCMVTLPSAVYFTEGEAIEAEHALHDAVERVLKPYFKRIDSKK